jgi:hypothetical protein
VSQRKWPWHRCVVLGLLILVVGIVGGWLLASCTTPDTSSSSSMSAMPSTETITVTIPDKDEQLSPDHPDQTGVKDRVEIPDAVLEKLALLLRSPSASGASTWGPLIVGALAAKIQVIAEYCGTGRVHVGGHRWQRSKHRTRSAASTCAKQLPGRR